MALPAAASAAVARLHPAWSSWNDNAAAAVPESDLLAVLGESCSFLRLNDLSGDKSTELAAPAAAVLICSKAAGCGTETVSFRSDMQSLLLQQLCML
jgi:hypothetical protein